MPDYDRNFSMRAIAKRFLGLLSALSLTACGTSLPVQDLRHPTRDSFNDFVNRIAAHVRCEMREAVKGESGSENRRFMDKWAAKVALTIRALDKGNFNPLVAVNNNPMSFVFTTAGTFEADGTREMTMTYFVTFEELEKDSRFVDRSGRSIDCDTLRVDSEAISGNLGIHDTLAAALDGLEGGRTYSNKIVGGPFDTITHHVIFVVIAGVGATPTFKYANVSANTAPSFLQATRTRTDELLITFGPAVLGTRKELKPSQALDQSFEIERLRSAIGTNYSGNTR